MSEQTIDPSKSFTHANLPRLGKRVLRLGVAGNYGLQTADIHHAAERGVGFWLWTPQFKAVTPALREILARDRDRHVVALLDIAYTGGMARRGIDKARRLLGIDQIDLYLLGWLNRTSVLSRGIQERLTRAKEEGSVRAIGCSTHDRKRAGQLAGDSILDALMIRYNAKHPGAEQDIFPHLDARDPIMVAYTATSWRQLLKPIARIEMPAWPGEPGQASAPPPLSPELCYRFCLSARQFHVTLTGPKTREQLDVNLRALEQEPLSAEEDAWVRQYGREVKARKKLPFL